MCKVHSRRADESQGQITDPAELHWHRDIVKTTTGLCTCIPKARFAHMSNVKSTTANTDANVVIHRGVMNDMAWQSWVMAAEWVRLRICRIIGMNDSPAEAAILLSAPAQPILHSCINLCTLHFQWQKNVGAIVLLSERRMLAKPYQYVQKSQNNRAVTCNHHACLLSQSTILQK